MKIKKKDNWNFVRVNLVEYQSKRSVNESYYKMYIWKFPKKTTFYQKNSKKLKKTQKKTTTKKQKNSSKTHFIFNSKFYNQSDGVAMGSPLAPTILTNLNFI